MAVLVDSPPGLLAAGAERLSASSVLENALAHAGAVGEELLAGVAGGVEEDLAGRLVDGEGGSVLLDAAVARGALVLEIQEEAIVGGLERGEVHGAGRADSDGLEDLDVRVGSGRGDASGDEGGEDDVLELHDGGGRVDGVVWSCL